jgi:hypothetical protein
MRAITPHPEVDDVSALSPKKSFEDNDPQDRRTAVSKQAKGGEA